MPITPRTVESQDLKATIKGLDGVEKEYVFNKLYGKKALRIFHNTVLLMAPMLACLEEDQENVMKELAASLKGISFDDVWALAENLLAFVIIDGLEIQDINKSDYFGEHPEELYLAVYHSATLNYPTVTKMLEDKLASSNVEFKNDDDQKEE